MNRYGHLKAVVITDIMIFIYFDDGNMMGNVRLMAFSEVARSSHAFFASIFLDFIGLTMAYCLKFCSFHVKKKIVLIKVYLMEKMGA